MNLFLQPVKIFARQQAWLILCLAAVAVLYCLTLLPGVGFNGDTAKFQFLGKILGTPHPTGYPTYLVLNAIFVRVFPLGSLAMRANLLSALFSLGAAAVLFQILQDLKVSKPATATAVLCFSLGKTVWMQSVIAEVYSLNLLFIALTSLFFLRWARSQRDVYFYLGCGVYAFAFGNHMTAVTILPALVYIVAAVNPRTFLSGRKIVFVLGVVALSALQYGYILWRSSIPGQLHLEASATDLAGLLRILTGQEFQGLMFTTPLLTLLTKTVPRFGFFFTRELLITLPLPVMGFLWFRGERKSKGFALIGLLGNLGFNLNYAIDDVYVYLIPSYFFLAILSGMGFEWLRGWLEKRWRRFPAALLLAVAACLLVANYHKADQSGNRADDARAQNVLAAVGEKALILTPNYDWYEYLNYYLYAGGLQREREIYQTSQDGIEEYLLRGQPFYGLKKYEPGQLTVYVMDDAQKQHLSGQGLRLEQVTSGLYRAVKP